MKYDLGSGMYLEGDAGGESPWRRRVVESKLIPNTQSGYTVTLECGHMAQVFGRWQAADGFICTRCRDEAEHVKSPG